MARGRVGFVPRGTPLSMETFHCMLSYSQATVKLVLLSNSFMFQISNWNQHTHVCCSGRDPSPETPRRQSSIIGSLCAFWALAATNASPRVAVPCAHTCVWRLTLEPLRLAANRLSHNAAAPPWLSPPPLSATGFCHCVAVCLCMHALPTMLSLPWLEW